MDGQLRLAGIVPESIVDGPGIRFVVFAQGCPHRCEGCHNPETHPFEGGFIETVESIAAKLAANPLLRGLTLSGGEPFCQPDGFAALAAAAHKLGLEVAAYTGYTVEQLLVMPEARPLLEQCEVIIDGPFVPARKSPEARFRGSDNQRTIDVAATLAAGRAVEDRSSRWNG